MKNLNLKDLCQIVVALSIFLIAISYLVERKANKFHLKVYKHNLMEESRSLEDCEVAGGDWVEGEDFDDCSDNCEDNYNIDDKYYEPSRDEKERMAEEEEECIERCHECK